MVARHMRFRVCSLVLGSLIGVAMIELGLRASGLGYSNSPVISDSTLHHKHPPDYEFVSFTPSGEYGGHRVKYDSHGLVSDPDGDREAEVAPSPRFRVAFMGDSFVEALQVPWASSFVGLLGRSGEQRQTVVKNFGVTSYSPILYALQWDDGVRDFDPTHVFLLLYSNDIRSDEKMARRVAWNGNGDPPKIPGPAGGWIVSRLRTFYLARLVRRAQLTVQWLLANSDGNAPVVGGFLEENPEVSSLSGQLVRSLARMVEATGAEFVLMVVPSKSRLLNGPPSEGSISFSEKWQKWAKVNGVSFLDLTPSFDVASALFFEVDIHFNEEGHRVMAELIAHAYPDLFGDKSGH